MEQKARTEFEKTFKNSNISKNDIDFKIKNLNNFIKNGFPNKKQETWKFSDLNQIISKNILNLSFYNDFSVPNKIDSSIFIDGLILLGREKSL